jgi:hypothetical protein
MRSNALLPSAIAASLTLSGCAFLKHQAHNASVRLTGVRCRPTGGTTEKDPRMIAPGTGTHILLCDNGMLLKSEKLEERWLSQEDVAAAREDVRRQKEAAKAEERKELERFQQEASRSAIVNGGGPLELSPEGRANLCRGPQLVMFLDNLHVQMGAVPQKGCLYSLTYEVPMQKLTDGYLISEHPQAAVNAGAGMGVVFLKTRKSFAQGALLRGFAYYTGRYSYTALDGFEKSVFAFTHYDGDPAKFRQYPARVAATATPPRASRQARPAP